MSDSTGAMVRYIDKGIVSEKKMPPTATFLMLHGDPTWSFVHRVERATSHCMMAPRHSHQTTRRRLRRRQDRLQMNAKCACYNKWDIAGMERRGSGEMWMLTKHNEPWRDRPIDSFVLSTRPGMNQPHPRRLWLLRNGSNKSCQTQDSMYWHEQRKNWQGIMISRIFFKEKRHHSCGLVHRLRRLPHCLLSRFECHLVLYPSIGQPSFNNY